LGSAHVVRLAAGGDISAAQEVHTRPDHWRRDAFAGEAVRWTIRGDQPGLCVLIVTARSFVRTTAAAAVRVAISRGSSPARVASWR
jgi:hypothetical protein